MLRACILCESIEHTYTLLAETILVKYVRVYQNFLDSDVSYVFLCVLVT